MNRAALRLNQSEHRMVLVKPAEFEMLLAGTLSLPQRHRDHFEKVLRRSQVWQAIVGDGQGRVVTAEISEAQMTVSSALQTIPSQETVALVQAWIKPKALALILQKCAELGVSSITLVDSDRAQPHGEKSERLETALESACMQAHNPFVPRLHIQANLTAQQLPDRGVFFGDPMSDERLPRAQTAFFINGPEGGFSPAERDWLAARAVGVKLSENVLRAETAAIIAVGILRLP